MAAAEVRYGTGPHIERDSGPNRGSAAMWVYVGSSDKMRPILLTNAQLIEIAAQCLGILKERHTGR